MADYLKSIAEVKSAELEMNEGHAQLFTSGCVILKTGGKMYDYTDLKNAETIISAQALMIKRLCALKDAMRDVK